MRKKILCVYLFFIPCFALHASLSIEQKIKNISSLIPGDIGVAALHLESGMRVEYNSNLLFPMASTYKIPIALYCLFLADQKKVNLQKKRNVTVYDQRRFSFLHLGQYPTVARLISLMVGKSCNAASDMVLSVVGGGSRVTGWLQKNHITNMRIDRSILKMIADYSGVKNFTNDDTCTVEQDMKMLRCVSAKDQKQAVQKFFHDKRDMTSPRAMVDLLEMLYRGKLVSAASKKFLLQKMYTYRRGWRRIPYLLPKGTRIWHKTGTMDGIVSDVGIIGLANGKGYVAIAIYTNNSISDKTKREDSIARIARALWDHFI